MKLTNIKKVNITPTVPFDFDSTFHKPDHFTSGDNYWEPGVRWQTLLWEDMRYGLKFENKGHAKSPIILLTIYSDSTVSDKQVSSLIEEVKYRYNLNLDLKDRK